LPTPKSVCYICNNTYSASFDGAKDAAYTAKYSHSPQMKQGRGKGRGKGKDKGREGTAGHSAARGWKGEGRRNGELTLTAEPQLTHEAV